MHQYNAPMMHAALSGVAVALCISFPIKSNNGTFGSLQSCNHSWHDNYFSSITDKVESVRKSIHTRLYIVG